MKQRYTTTIKSWNLQAGDIIINQSQEKTITAAKWSKSHRVKVSFSDGTSDEFFEQERHDLVAYLEPLPEVKCTTPAGAELVVPQILQWDDRALIYDVCGLVCPVNGDRSDGGNYKTGEVLGWLSKRTCDQSQREYERQMHSAEQREAELAEAEGGDLY